MNDAKFYCNVTALTPEERARYQEFEKVLSSKVKSIDEEEHGYALSFPMEPDTFVLFAEFVTYERRCCSFLDFNLNIDAGKELASLRITGPEGAKAFIQAELGMA